MSRLFEELDYRVTPLGALALRRRRNLTTDKDVYEIKLNDEFLMSSTFTESEKALASLALGEHAGGELSVVVGGLGLGYTAARALDFATVGSLLVVEALEAVVEWHRQGLLPLGERLTQDPRCRLVHGDFFAMALSPETGFDPLHPGARFDAILLDIDHSPHHVLAPGNAQLYTREGLETLASHLKPGGIFALWSNDPEAPEFTDTLRSVFESARNEPVVFYNPLQDREARQSVYLARRGKAAS